MPQVAQPAPAKNERLELLQEGYPDYQSFTPRDFEKLSDPALRSIIGAFNFNLNPGSLIPQSFVRAYGDDAAGMVLWSAQQAAINRGKPALYAVGLLNGGLGNLSDKITGGDVRVNSEVPASITLADNTVRNSTPAAILNYKVAQDVLGVMAANEEARKQGTYTPQKNIQVVVPQAAIAAVVAANKLPAQLAKKPYTFIAHDELSAVAGSATRAGASDSVAATNFSYPASAVCSAWKMFMNAANPNKPDGDVALGWAAGNILTDVAQKLPPVQRTNPQSFCPVTR